MENLVPSMPIPIIPLPLKFDIRGWTEMHPLNGPAWSLYYESVSYTHLSLVLMEVGILATMAVLLITVSFKKFKHRLE